MDGWIFVTKSENTLELKIEASMKKWGSYVVDGIGYFIIGWIMDGYGVHGLSAGMLMLWILLIQRVVSFIKEIVEY